MVPEGETERLILRPLQLADAAQIQELFPRWEIVQYLQNIVPWPYPADGALEFVCNTLPAVERGDQWIWTLRLRADAERVIGVLNLRRGDEDNRGFWLGPAWQRRGLMTEACAWANDFWFVTLGFETLRVTKAAKNVASRRISEKHGMRLVAVGEKDYVCGRLPSEVWELTAEEWQAWKKRSASP